MALGETRGSEERGDGRIQCSAVELGVKVGPGRDAREGSAKTARMIDDGRQNISFFFCFVTLCGNQVQVE